MTPPGRFVALYVVMQVVVCGIGIVVLGLVLRWPPYDALLLFLSALPVIAVTALVAWRRVRSPWAAMAITGGAGALILAPAYAIASGRGWGAVPFLAAMVLVIAVVNGVLSARLDGPPRR